MSATFTFDPLVFGHRLRHHRGARGLTLAELGEKVGRQAPYLSQLENARREPPLSLVGRLAAALEITPGDLLADEPPTRRAALEIALVRAQEDPLYRELGLPPLAPSARLPDEALEHLVALYEEVRRRAQVRAETPEEARQHNSALRAAMREAGNYFPAIEAVAAEALDAIGYEGGSALSQPVITRLARHFGFTVEQVGDLPPSVRSLTDLRHRRIYIPQRDEPGAQHARTVVLQTLGHFALDHADPSGFGEFLRQRVEANYFAGALLMPERAVVALLREAKAARDLAVTDLEEQFYVSYEMAAHRFTNLVTHHLDVPVHFVRSDEEGVIWKAYENDGVPFPADPDGAIEGQRLCRRWGTRQVFGGDAPSALHSQYTDTPAGTYWCVTHLEAGRDPQHAVTVGTVFAESQWFRGRDTARRATSGCPSEPCCRSAPADLTSRWDGWAWPSPRAHSHVLAALPAGRFPGVDVPAAYDFLERHAVG